MNDYQMRTIREALENSRPRQMTPDAMARHSHALLYVNNELGLPDSRVFSGAELRQAEAVRLAERWGGRTSGPVMEITTEDGGSWTFVFAILGLLVVGIAVCIAVG